MEENEGGGQSEEGSDLSVFSEYIDESEKADADWAIYLKETNKKDHSQLETGGFCPTPKHIYTDSDTFYAPWHRFGKPLKEKHHLLFPTFL